jgi:predicted RNA binding protein YcfA (HicA-like mRNA interferase family)
MIYLGPKGVAFMPRSPRITAFQLLRALRHDGWRQVRQSGSHVTLRHPTKSGSVTVPKHATVIIKPKTLEAILEQAELTLDDFRELL